MKKKYSTTQIKEAISYWKNQLKKLDESDENDSIFKSLYKTDIYRQKLSNIMDNPVAKNFILAINPNAFDDTSRGHLLTKTFPPKFANCLSCVLRWFDEIPNSEKKQFIDEEIPKIAQFFKTAISDKNKDLILKAKTVKWKDFKDLVKYQLDESDDMYNEYKSVCVKYGPKFKQALEMVQAFKAECPADATCIVDGIVDDFINAATEMDEWCEGTLQTSPNDYEY